MTSLTKDWDFRDLLWPQIFRGVGLMLSMVPITNISLGTLSPVRLKDAVRPVQPRPAIWAVLSALPLLTR